MPKITSHDTKNQMLVRKLDRRTMLGFAPAANPLMFPSIRAGVDMRRIPGPFALRK
jgi:hypothetical protein